MKFYVISEYDANDFFEVEADTPEEAALQALECVGWNLCEVPDECESEK